VRKTFVVLLCLTAWLAAAQAQTRPRRPARRPVPQKPAPAPPPADLVIVNAKVFSGVTKLAIADPPTGGQPEPAGAAQEGFAQAVAIRADRIVAVGSEADVKPFTGPETRVIDASGRVVVPGFNDAHAHPSARPESVSVDSGDSPTPDPTFKEVLKRVADAAAKAPKGTWIVGTIGATIIDDAEATRFGLDEVSKANPVLLRAWTGHGTFFNTAAMKVLGLSETEPDPPGGFFTRLRKGGSDRTLSGFAHEYAEYRIERKLAESVSDEQIVAAFREFAREAVSFGITTVQAMMVSHDAERVGRLLADANLPLRVRLVRFPLEDPAAWAAPASTEPPSADTALSVWGTKWIFDGTPVERLAFLRQEYSDRARWRGQANFKDAAVRPMFVKALESRAQVMVHAVGGGTIEQVFSAMTAAGSPLRWQSRRLRIEHGDMLTDDLLARAKSLGVILVQNPTHLSLRELDARIGSGRLARAQLMKAVVGAGVPLAIGSDGPLNPGLNLMLATLHPNNPKEALSREEAVRAYTAGSAYAEFADQEKGTIAPKMLADLAILSQDIFTVPPDALPATTAVMTIAGGKVVHEKMN
jgi:hypothetical protein